MYSDNYRGGYQQSRGRRTNYYRGRGGGGFGGQRPFNGRHNDSYDNVGDPPPYNAIQEYSPQPLQRQYRGSPARGNYSRGGFGGRRHYNNYRGRHPGGGGGYDYQDNRDGGRYFRPNQHYGGGRGYYQHQQPTPNYQRRNWGGGRPPYRGREGYPPRDGRADNRIQNNGLPPPYADPPFSQIQRHEEDYLHGLSWFCDLEAHRSRVNALAFEDETGMLYTGGADGIVRQWNGNGGQVEHSASYNGEVTALLVEQRHLFLSIHRTVDEAGNSIQESGDVHIYNLNEQSEQKFTAHRGRILALHVAGDLLISAGDDGAIKAWKYNRETGVFDHAGVFADEGIGHNSPVECLTSLGMFLFSGQRNGSILAWNLESGQLAQRLDRAHNRTVTGMICWKGALITGSLDQTIKTWNLDLAQTAHQVMKTPPAYSNQITSATGEPAAVLSLCGACDVHDSPVLMTGVASNEVVLFDLPQFSVRSRILNVQTPRSLGAASRECLFVGLMSGVIRVYQWDGEGTDEGAMVS